MSKVCLIRQPAGLGDIIFCQKIAQKYIEKGYQIYWPTADVYYETVNKYMKKNGIVFCRENDNFPMKELYNSGIFTPAQDNLGNIYLPLQYSDRSVLTDIPFDVMSVKYKFINMDYSDWQDYFVFKRDIERENNLFYNILNLTEDKKYNIVNRWFGTTWDGYRKNMDIKSDLPIIEMKNLGFDNIFDWCKVFENAAEIHTVDTAICYILEKLDLKADRKCWYTRNLPEKGYSYVKGVYTNIEWEFIL